MRVKLNRIQKWTIFTLLALILFVGIASAIKDIDKKDIKCDKDITKEKLKSSSWSTFQVCEYTSPLTNKTWTIIKHK